MRWQAARLARGDARVHTRDRYRSRRSSITTLQGARLRALVACVFAVATTACAAGAQQGPTAELAETDAVTGSADQAGTGTDVPGAPVEDADAAPPAAPPTTADAPPADGPLVVPPLPPEEYTVPDVVDAGYAARVMTALDHALGEAARDAADEQSLGTGFFEHVVAAHSERALSATVVPAWQGQAEAGFPDLADDPGDPVTTIAALERADPGCIVFRGSRDFNGIYREPRPAQEILVALVPPERDIDPELNPTPYVLNWAAEPVEDPCA